MAHAMWALAFGLLAALVLYGMRRGWVNRSRNQVGWLPEFPEVPEVLGDPVASSVNGLYVGTTTSGDWQNRIAVGDIGHRANCVVTLYSSGLLLERSGASALWIPSESVVDGKIAAKLANKVIPGKGLFVVTWKLGDHSLDTGFRADSHEEQHALVDRVRERAGSGNDMRQEAR